MKLTLSKGSILFLLSCLIYSNSLFFDYALDDALVITKNEFTKRGIDGIGDIFTNEFFTGFFGQKKELVAGGRYRPFSMALFALEYELFGQSPAISHFVNILLYAGTVVLLYLMLSDILPKSEKAWYKNIPFVASLLFCCHPLHTEVVANIKGRDEILTLLASLGSLYSMLRCCDAEKRQFVWGLFAFLLFLIALFSKENAISYLAVIPFALLYFKNQSLKKALIATLPLVIASAIFLWVRSEVLGGFSSDIPAELMNDPFLGTTASEKYATVFYTWFIYVKLLFLPHPLTYDYYPYHITITSFADIFSWIGLIVIVGAAFVGLYYFIQSLLKNDFSENGKLLVWSAILFFSSFSIVSNLLFSIGAFMNERFMYMPSVGFAIAIAFFFVNYLSATIGKYFPIVFILLVSGYSAKAFYRNFAWKNDFTLFTTDVHTSYNSAKSTCSAGGKLLERAKDQNYSAMRDEYLARSLIYLRRSIAIYPGYVEALLLLGNCHFEYSQYDSTLFYYRKIVEKAPGHQKVYENLPIVLAKIEDKDKQLAICMDFQKVNSVNYDLNYKIGVIYGRYKGDLQKSIFYLERAVKIDPKRKEGLKDLGVAYGMAQRPVDAEKILERAIQADPQDGQTYLNLGVTFQNLGKLEKAKQMFAKAVELDPSLAKK